MLRFLPTLARRTPSLWSRAFSSLPEHTVVGMPALSPTMEQGNIAEWKVKEGDEIKAGEIQIMHWY